MKKILHVNVLMTVIMMFLAGSVFALPLGSVSDLNPVAADEKDGILNNTNPSVADLNNNGYWYNDWQLLQKQNTPSALETNVDIGLIVSPTTGTNTGTYSFNSSIWDTYENLMIVLKDGNLGQSGIYWFAYLLADNNFSGTWTYPGGKDLSYLAVYGSTSVPEPAMMLLFGTGLVGLVGVARRRNKK